MAPKAKAKAKAKPKLGARSSSGSDAAIASVGQGVRVAYLPDPVKFGVKKGYPRPGVRDRLKEGAFEFQIVTPGLVRGGGLVDGRFHVLVVPGGFAPNFAEALSDIGGRRIREFLAAGGAYVGICAGAYLGSTWGYDLLPVDILDMDHWNRGKTENCRLRATSVGSRLLGFALPEMLSVRYANGPLFDVLDESVEILLTFESQLRGSKGNFPALMRGSPAVIAGPHGNGKVVLISPHMEDKPEHGHIFRGLFEWAVTRSLAREAEASHKDDRVPNVPCRLDEATHKHSVTSAADAAQDDTMAPTSRQALADESVRLKTVEAVIEAFEAVSHDGIVDRSDLVDVLGQLDSFFTDDVMGTLLRAFDVQCQGGVPIDRLIEWLLDESEVVRTLRREDSSPVEGSLPAPDDRADTDGEDSELDIPALVRLRSAASFEPFNDLDVCAEVADIPPPPSLDRTCSCCSGRQRSVSSAEVETSVVKIQQAVRSSASKSKEKGRQSSRRPVEQEPSNASMKGPIPRPSSSLPGPTLLTRGSSDYLCSLQGPILLTAPHSLKLQRGGGDTGEGTRNHKRERWTAEMATALARELNRAGIPASVLVWNRAAAPARGRLDPNYLMSSSFAASPWHRALHRWMLSAGNGGKVPLFHVDLHGKVSEKLHLDLGIAPLQEVWPRAEQGFVSALGSLLSARLDDAMERRDVRSLKGKLLAVDPDPRLHGYWGHDTVTTISHQSVMLGIPAVQFEMPPRLRERLVSDAELCRLFAETLAQAYREIVCPWWQSHSERGRARPCQSLPDASLAADVVETELDGPKGFEVWSSQLLSELMALERASSEVQI